MTQRTSDDLLDLLRLRRLESRNCDEEAKERLMSQAADEIEALRHDLSRSMANHVADINAPLTSNPVADPRALLAEAEKYITGFAASAESGFARRKRAEQWLQQYREWLATADETPAVAKEHQCREL